MSSQYVGDFVAEQQYEAAEEKEWREREGTEIPPWMDEEEITAREYEDDEWMEEAKEQQSGPRMKAW